MVTMEINSQDDGVIDLSSQDISEIPDTVLSCSQIHTLILDFNDIALFPSILCEKLTNLTYLSMNGNLFNSLPHNIGKLKKLTKLFLKENNLKYLPESICELSELTKLHLTGNQICRFPENFGLLFSLYELIADENDLSYLPNNFGNLQHLTHLDISNNCLQELPDNFGMLISLKELNISNNNIQVLPESFCDLPNLEVLDLTKNEIQVFPDKFLSSIQITKLLLNENSLTKLPNWLSESKNLQELSVSANDLLEMSFPEDFGLQNDKLESIDVSGNNITSLPESFGKLKKLKFLDLGSSFEELERNRFIYNGNNLRYLPNSFTDLIGLVKLELDENQISELPLCFGQLVNLIYLDLSHNDLEMLPDSFSNLSCLKICMLSMNDLIELPKNFGMLSALEDLKLDNNKLKELPDTFNNLKALTALDLYNNNLKEIPGPLLGLKQLKHLDLRENDFGLPLDKIPDIAYEPKYLARKEEYRNTWRGRERLDINPFAWVESREDTVNENKLNDDIIYSALASSSSLWRKHHQPNIRQNLLNDKNDVENNVIPDSEECWDEDIGEICQNDSPEYKENLSDWEDDYDAFEKLKVFQHPVQNTKPDINVLVPSDLHVENIKVTEKYSSYDTGQFDDADL